MTHQTVATAANTMMKQMNQPCFRCHRYLIMSQRMRILPQSHTKMSVSAEATCTCGSGGDDGRMCVHVFNEVLGHSLQFFHFPHIQGNTSAWDRNWAGGRRLCLHTHGQIQSSVHKLQTFIMAFIMCKKNEHAWKIELQRTADGGGVFTGWL